MNPGLEKLKRHWNENPIETLAIGSLAVGAFAKIIDTLSHVRSRNAYAKRFSRKGK